MADEGRDRGSWRGLAIGTIAVVAAGCGLALAKEVLVPIAIALLLYALIRPLVRRLSRWHVPAPLSAVLVVVGIVALLFGIGAAFAQPLKEWSHRAPETIAKAREKFAGITRKLPLAGMASGGQGSQASAGTSGGKSASGQSGTHPESGSAGGASATGATASPVKGGSAGGDASTGGGASNGGASSPSTGGGGPSTGGGASAGGGTSGGPSSGGSSGGGSSGGGSSPLTGILGRVFGTTASLITGAIEILLLLAFLLAAGDRLKQKVQCAIRGSGDRERAVRVAEEIEAVVSRYVVATALINVGQGVTVALAMWALGLPTPALWGLLTVVVEFVPYLGALLMVVLLAVAGLATFGSFGHAMAAPAAYITISTLQNNLVSPIAYGNRLKLSPAVILVAVMLWWFLWGVAGAVVAVPIVAALKVLTEHVPSLKRFTELLSD